jgi:hypothetical protein
MVMVVAHATSAHADETNPAAEKAFVDGIRLIDAGQIDAGCEQLAESRRLEPAAGTLLRLADCRERQGRVASAWFHYREAISASYKRGLRDWAAHCEERANALEKRLPKIVLRVPVDAHPARIELNGVEVPASAWGHPWPVDPGEVNAVIQYERAITVKANAAEGVTTELSVPPTSPERRGEREQPDAGTGNATMRMLGWASLSVGAAAAAFGGVATVIALSKRDDARSLCPSSPCASLDGVRTNDSARDWGNVALGGFIGAGALIGTGITLLVLSPSSSPTKGATLRAGLGGAGVVGVF